MELTIEQEHELFSKQLEKLLPLHQGEYVLFKDGKPVEFFKDSQVAFGAGIERFGPHSVFLIAPVQDTAPASMAWVAGVMFG